MGIFGSRDKRRQNEEEDDSLLRKEKRRQRIEKRIEEKKLREELVQNTMYPETKVTKKSFVGKKKDPFEEERIIDRNNERKKKRGEKVKFKDLSTGKKFLRVFKWFMITMLIFGLLILAAGTIAFYYFLNEKSDIDEKDLLLTKQNSEVYDRDENHLATLSVDEKRKIISLSDMSKYIPEAYISMEDERFYNHMGVDFQRTATAMFTYITHKGKSSYGASTLTQQLIKNITKDDERDWKRKVREITRAINVEKKLSKSQILELYLNLIYMGGQNIHGIALRK